MDFNRAKINCDLLDFWEAEFLVGVCVCCSLLCSGGLTPFGRFDDDA